MVLTQYIFKILMKNKLTASKASSVLQTFVYVYLDLIFIIEIVSKIYLDTEEIIF